MLVVWDQKMSESGGHLAVFLTLLHVIIDHFHEIVQHLCTFKHKILKFIDF